MSVTFPLSTAMFRWGEVAVHVASLVQGPNGGDGLFIVVRGEEQRITFDRRSGVRRGDVVAAHVQIGLEDERWRRWRRLR